MKTYEILKYWLGRRLLLGKTIGRGESLKFYGIPYVLQLNVV